MVTSTLAARQGQTSENHAVTRILLISTTASFVALITLSMLV